MSTKTEDLVQAHIDSLSSTDEETRRTAIRSLGQLGPDAAPALPQLRTALSDSDFVIRLEAAIAIGFIGTKEDSQYLIPLLNDEEQAVRFQTISALAFLKDSRATPELIRIYENETIHVQDQILRALGHLKGPEAYDLLEQELQNVNPTVRTGAVVGLSFFGNPRACPRLREVAESDPDEIVAHEAKLALLQIEKTSSQDCRKA